MSDKSGPRKITQAGQPCRHCGSPVVRDEHAKPPKYKPGGYWFRWWLKCPNVRCKAMYMQESAKVWFDPPAQAMFHIPPDPTFMDDGRPPWEA